jgi:methylated-DNA-[protein]-cysteine S-methyltransferase
MVGEDKIMDYSLFTPVGEIKLKLLSDGSLGEIAFGAENPAKKIHHKPRATTPVLEQMVEYFKGARKTFDVSYQFPGTAFQQAVWRQIAKIPYGKTITYGDIAKKIGKPNSSRAVGMACGQNPFSIIVPCHRVVGSQGKLTGYGGGLWRKQWLLAFEQQPDND